MKVSVVIGANYGDEGKGVVTDYLASRSKSIVVRFNGGPQAGHTVVTPEGRRHVFHHIGAGTFAGSPTFLSKYFAVNPMFFLPEYYHLKKQFNIDPIVYIDNRAMLTTPYDIMINQALEDSRGGKRHGSCGMGFGETVERWSTEFETTMDDCTGQAKLIQILDEIRRIWVPLRCAELKIPEIDSVLLFNDEILLNFAKDVQEMLDLVTISDLGSIHDGEDLVFEGAQGLMLDQGFHFYPYVTRSHTGVRNVINILKHAEIQTPPELYYVSRTYTTRHGAGPLEYETDIPLDEDLTNLENRYQGKLRYGRHCLESLANAISTDHKSCFDATFVLTHCDLNEGQVTYYDSHRLETIPHMLFAARAAMHSECRDYLMFTGPTRDHVKFP